MHGERDVTLVEGRDQPPSPDATRRMAGALHQELDELDGLAEELLLSLLLAREWDDDAAERVLDGQRRRLEDAEDRLRHRLAEAVIEREAEAVVARAQHATDVAAGQAAPAGRRMPATVAVAVLTLVAALLAVGDVTPPLDYVADQRAVEARDPADLPDLGGPERAVTDHLAPMPNRDPRIPDRPVADPVDGDRDGSFVDGNAAQDAADGGSDGQGEFLDPGDLVSGLVQERVIANLLEEMTELLAAGGDIQREIDSDTGTDRSAPGDDDGSSRQPRDEASDQPTDSSGQDESRDGDAERGQDESTSGSDDDDGADSDAHGDAEDDADADDDSDSTVPSEQVVGGLD